MSAESSWGLRAAPMARTLAQPAEPADRRPAISALGGGVAADAHGSRAASRELVRSLRRLRLFADPARLRAAAMCSKLLRGGSARAGRFVSDTRAFRRRHAAPACARRSPCDLCARCRMNDSRSTISARRCSAIRRSSPSSSITTFSTPIFAIRSLFCVGRFRRASRASGPTRRSVRVRGDDRGGQAAASRDGNLRRL